MSMKRALGNLLLLIAAVGVPLVAAELSLRVVAGKTTATVFEDRPGFERFRGMKPSYEAYVYGVPMMTNDLGFRDDRPHVPSKTSSDFRVVVLGNSTTVGLGIPYEQIFSSQLEQNLAASMGATDLAPQVINLAVGAYNAVQYRLTMEEVGWQLDPDVVVVGLLVAADFETVELIPHAERGKRRWHERTRLWQRLAPQLGAITHLVRRFSAPRKSPAAGPRPPDFGPGANGWAENAGALIELKAEADARGTPLVVFFLPTASDFQAQQTRHRVAGEFCAQHQIPFVDLLPEFALRKRPPESYRLNVIDGHPNVAYHQLVGRLMSEPVERAGRDAPRHRQRD